MTIKAGHFIWFYFGFILVDYQTELVTSLYSHVIFWLYIYFSGLSNRIIRKKDLVTGDWSQSNMNVAVADNWAEP